jgi:hypothetical protein
MLRKFVCATVGLVLVAGVALAAEEKAEGKKPRGKLVFGKLLKCDADKGIVCVMVKKSKDDEGTKMEYKINDETKFVAGSGGAEKPLTFTKGDFGKDEFKAKFKEGTIVGVLLDDTGTTAKRVMTGIRRRPKE